MSLQTTIQVNTTFTPPRAIFSVRNHQTGPPQAVNVNVMISWDPTYVNCPGVVGPAGSVLHTAHCSWSNYPIPANQTRFFTIQVERWPGSTATTYVIGTAHDPANDDDDGASVAMP